MNFLGNFVALFIAFLEVAAEFRGCDYFQALRIGAVYSIASSGYPRNYNRGASCRWSAEAPPGYIIQLNCNEVRLPLSTSCLGDQLLVSTSGRTDLRDGRRYCGSGSFAMESKSTRLTVGLRALTNSRGGKFRCSMKTKANSCECGRRNLGRIVGGSETRINEFPSMLGIVDADERRIYCGATLISSTHALSAAHCKRTISRIGLLIGEHDVNIGSDTPYTVLLKIAAFTQHPNFDTITNANDIALVKASTTINFTRGVQPACLPFKFRNINLISKSVQALGWGSKEFAGPQSSKLQGVTLDIVSSRTCSAKQICTFTRFKDTCQSDSGGPLLYIENGTTYHVGIISYGIACATDVAVNTKVASYLDWILENTRTTYCVR